MLFKKEESVQLFLKDNKLVIAINGTNKEKLGRLISSIFTNELREKTSELISNSFPEEDEIINQISLNFLKYKGVTNPIILPSEYQP